MSIKRVDESDLSCWVSEALQGYSKAALDLLIGAHKREHGKIYHYVVLSSLLAGLAAHYSWFGLDALKGVLEFLEEDQKKRGWGND